MRERKRIYRKEGNDTENNGNNWKAEICVEMESGQDIYN